MLIFALYLYFDSKLIMIECGMLMFSLLLFFFFHFFFFFYKLIVRYILMLVLSVQLCSYIADMAVVILQYFLGRNLFFILNILLLDSQYQIEIVHHALMPVSLWMKHREFELSLIQCKDKQKRINFTKLHPNPLFGSVCSLTFKFHCMYGI